MNYNIAKPDGFISQYVKQYWSLENCLSPEKKHLQRIVPSGLFELIFYFDDKPKSSDPNKDLNHTIMLSGQLLTHHDLIVTGKLSLFAIYFHPHGLSMFLDLPMKELLNQSIPLKDLIKESVNQLEDELAIAPSLESRIQIAESFLIRRIQENEKKYKFDRIRSIVNKINQSGGQVEIEALVADSFLSRKQFERTFSEFIGTSPKQFLRIVRFQNAIYQKSKNTELSLTEIAHLSGYFDQSHMVNDFKLLSGHSPKSFFNSSDFFSDYFG